MDLYTKSRFRYQSLKLYSLRVQELMNNFMIKMTNISTVTLILIKLWEKDDKINLPSAIRFKSKTSQMIKTLKPETLSESE